MALLLIYIFLSYYSCPSDNPDPVLPPERDLPIPAYWQLYSMWCGHACIEMWAHYRGNWMITQESLARDPYICDSADPWTGMYVYQIIRGVNKYADSAAGDCSYDLSDDGKNMIFSRITAALSDGQPSILVTLNEYTLEKHALIVKGYDTYETEVFVPNIKSVRYNDPWNGSEEEETFFDMKTSIYHLVCVYMSEAERINDLRSCGYVYIMGLGNKPLSQIYQDGATGYSEYLKRCGTYYGGPQVYIPAGSTFLRVRYPQGGEELLNGKSEQIKWEANGLSGNIRLELYRNDALVGLIAENLPMGTGTYNWLVGECQDETVHPGNGYKVKVSRMDDSYDDFSNAAFSIGGITVTSPNGGESWEQGSSEDITWDSSYVNGNVEIILLKTNTGTEYLIEESTENDGIYNWTVGMCSHTSSIPEDPQGMVVPGSTYKIKIVSLNDPGVLDKSDANFTISPDNTASISVTSPNGGESLTIGSIHQVTWTSSGVDGDVKIEYSTDSGTTWTVIVSAAANDGSYQWPVPDTSSDNCVVRISASDGDGGPSDMSNAAFSIVPPSLPTLIVMSPNGGEKFYVGSTYAITWTSYGTVGDVKIEYSTDNGDSWSTILDAAANNGSYDWPVPDTSSGICLVKVSETDGDPSDASDVVFSILPLPSITVTSPNGGESLTIGSIHQVTWTSSGIFDNVTIEYSTDNGNTWLTIAECTPNDGSFDWIIPDNKSANCLVRVSGCDTDGNPQDVSDALFSIFPHPDYPNKIEDGS